MFAKQIRSQLEPLFKVVLDELAEGGDSLAFAFFAERMGELNTAEGEEDVINMFINLSQAAFLGFQYTEQSWAKVDDLLAQAESVSHAMTANGSQ